MSKLSKDEYRELIMQMIDDRDIIIDGIDCEAGVEITKTDLEGNPWQEFDGTLKLIIDMHRIK